MNNYKTICDKCHQETWYETEQPCKMTISVGCPTCGSHEFISKEQRCTGTLRIIDNSALDDRFTSYYESKERVEITYTTSKIRGYIGKSTGWKPVYLLILRKNSMGGEILSTENIINIKGLNKYK